MPRRPKFRVTRVPHPSEGQQRLGRYIGHPVEMTPVWVGRPQPLRMHLGGVNDGSVFYFWLWLSCVSEQRHSAPTHLARVRANAGALPGLGLLRWESGGGPLVQRSSRSPFLTQNDGFGAVSQYFRGTLPTLEAERLAACSGPFPPIAPLGRGDGHTAEERTASSWEVAAPSLPSCSLFNRPRHCPCGFFVWFLFP